MGCRVVWSPARTFTASCTQPVREVSYTVPSAPLGQHMVRVTAANANGSGENYWTWNVLSTPPMVRRVNPAEQDVTDTIHSLRQFEASSDQTAVMKIYVNGFLIAENASGIQYISCTFGEAAFGNYLVRVIAENTNGSGETTWNWHIRSADPPVVSLIQPATQEITDQIGTLRMFRASPNQPAYLEFTFDGLPVCKKYASWENFPCSCEIASRSAGDHKVEVTAVNANGRDTKHWDWRLTYPTPCIENDTKCKGHNLCKCVNGQWTVIEPNSPQCGWTDPLTLHRIQHYINLFCQPMAPTAAAVRVETDPFHTVSIETYDFKSYTYSGTVKYSAERFFRNIELEIFVYQLYFFAGDPDDASTPVSADNINIAISNVKPSVTNLVNPPDYTIETKPIKELVKPVYAIQKVTGIHPDTQGYILTISVPVNWTELMLALPEAEFSIGFDLHYTLTIKYNDPQVNTFTRHWAYSGNDSPLIRFMMTLAGFCMALETVPTTAT